MMKVIRDDLRRLIDSGAAQPVFETPGQWAAPLRHRFSMIFEELEMQADWQIPETWTTTPSAFHCLTMRRVLEEALTNVIKHSRASHVSVKLIVSEPQHLSLDVLDNGVGFDVMALQNHDGGVGMRSMRACIARLGGTLTVTRADGITALRARMLLVEMPTAA